VTKKQNTDRAVHQQKLNQIKSWTLSMEYKLN